MLKAWSWWGETKDHGDFIPSYLWRKDTVSTDVREMEEMLVRATINYTRGYSHSLKKEDSSNAVEWKVLSAKQLWQRQKNWEEGMGYYKDRMGGG